MNRWRETPWYITVLFQKLAPFYSATMVHMTVMINHVHCWYSTFLCPFNLYFVYIWLKYKHFDSHREINTYVHIPSHIPQLPPYIWSLNRNSICTWVTVAFTNVIIRYVCTCTLNLQSLCIHTCSSTSNSVYIKFPTDVNSLWSIILYVHT